jgi:ferredoxin--NADP+ reductase
VNQILQKSLLGPKVFELIVSAPRIARKAQPGQFVVVMADEGGERIPLTIADYDRNDGTITLVLAVVGASSLKLSRFEIGQSLYALIGPLGKASEVERCGAVVMVAGGVGAAPIYPIARAFHEIGDQVITIQGARTRELLFWTDRLGAVSDRHIVTTDDGSFGRKGVVTGPLADTLREDLRKSITRVYAIGPEVMMKFCAATTLPFGVKTIVSLNTIMVDGTGMCGGCRVEVGRQTQFTCVDGPEFDGHLVNWPLLVNRQRAYAKHEACSLDRQLHVGESEV